MGGSDAGREEERRTGEDGDAARTGGPRRSLRGWDSLVERQIREAMEAGALDDLPFQGERLPPEEPGAWGVAGPILRRAGAAPPWIEADKQIRALLDERDGILRRAAWSSPLGRRRDREAIVRVVGEVNALVLRLEQEAPTPMQHRRRLDLDEELSRLEAAWGRRSGGREPPGS